MTAQAERTASDFGPWPRCPEAAAWFAQMYRAFAQANPLIEELETRFRDGAGVDIRALIDHWVLPDTPETRAELAAIGLTLTPVPGEEDNLPIYEHRAARFPRVRLDPEGKQFRIALGVEDIPGFLTKNSDLLPPVEKKLGGPFCSEYEEYIFHLEHGALAVVKRVGYRGFRTAGRLDEAELVMPRHAMQKEVSARLRQSDETQMIAVAQNLVAEFAVRFGQAWATDAFFAVEREFYLTRNRAAQWQYARQQAIGIGWANHDHHTYRSSRQNFRDLMRLFQTLGFEFRERFYAGAEAGWGAQILEHPVSRVVIFADVDLAPEELDIDFAREELPPRDTLGTIGLWCALHGDSIGAAGMHHLEAEYDYAHVRALLEANGYGVMAPFTDLPMLKQAFTQPERWAVAPERLQALLERGAISPEQAAHFAEAGAPGSHLEILQRWEGFKGFNKTGVSAIIRQTDARNAD